jgi:hypothetical protein
MRQARHEPRQRTILEKIPTDDYSRIVVGVALCPRRCVRRGTHVNA